MAALNNLILLVGRLFMAGLFIYDGVVIVRNWQGTVGYMAAHGAPSLALPLVVVLQLLGGLFVVVGFQTRYTAIAFAGFALLTALVFHTDFSNGGEVLQFGKDIAISGGFLFLFVAGPGAFSFDRR